MKIVWVAGGLGNQFFQYAFAKAYSIKNNCEVLLDISFFKNRKIVNDTSIGGQHSYYGLKLYKTKIKLATPEQCTMLKRNGSHQNTISSRKGYILKKNKKSVNSVIKEKYPGAYEPSLIDNKDSDVYFKGYMQSEKYFYKYRNELINDLTLDIPLDYKNTQMLELIRSTNSVSLHVRRGDYASIKGRSLILPISYYKNAIRFIVSNTNNPHFYVFSNDIEWVNANLQLEKKYTVIDFNPPNKGYFDLELMRNCKHNITANSSFSWWGAWLNQNPEKIVIAPNPWFEADSHRFEDIIPRSWIKIER